MDMYQRHSNYKCDYCHKPMYVRPAQFRNNKYHTCSMDCQTKLLIKCPSKTYLMWLHWACEMPQQKIVEFIGTNRSVLKKFMNKHNIPTRTISEDMKRRYRNMTEDQIKAQAKKAQNKRRIHGNSGERWYLNSVTRRYRATKLFQTPELTENEKAKVELYYRVSQQLGDAWHVDHIVPLSKGGLHHPDNLQVVTKDYNLQKNNTLNFRKPKTLEHWST